MKRILTVCAALMAAPLLHAVEAGWSNESADVQLWTTAAGDGVSFPTIDRSTMRTVNLCDPAVAAASADWSIGSVSGPRLWTLCLPGYSGSQTANSLRTFGFDDVNGFAGTWKSSGTMQTLRLNAESGVQTLEVLDAPYRLNIDVANAAAEAKVNLVRNAGALEKKGAGKLTLGTIHEANQDVYLAAGTLELEGTISASDPLFRQALVHLDASREDTIEKHQGEDGRWYVSRWKHASGGTVDAEIWDNSADKSASHIKRPHEPYINYAATSTTGLPLMDFGAGRPETVELYGPTNCVLKFSTFLRGVREVFYVDMHSDVQYSVSNYSLCLDNSSSIIFSGNDTYAFKYQYDATLNGEVRFNGIQSFPVWASNKYQYRRPCDAYSPTWDALTLTSVALASEITLNHLCADQLYYYPSGGMRIGEILVFDKVLTADERRRINHYLMRKWFKSYPREEVANLHVANNATAAISVPAGMTAKVSNLVVNGTSVKKLGAGTLVVGRTFPENVKFEVVEGAVTVDPPERTITTETPTGTPLIWYDGDQEGAIVESGDSVVNWKDQRSDYATTRQGTAAGSALPVKEEVVINGKTHTVVNFATSGSNGSRMSFPDKIGGNWTVFKEGFIVINFANDTLAQLYPIFGSGTYAFARNWYNIFDPTVSQDDWGGASCTVNGKPIDPFVKGTSDGKIFKGGEWYVVSLGCNGAWCSWQLAADCGKSRCGGVKIGEFVGYNTALTAEQRRDTVAYLMKKWLGTEHPEAGDHATVDYEYPASRPIILADAADASVHAVSGGNGTIVKTGAGETRLQTSVDGIASGFTVEDGSLVLEKGAFVEHSAYHFDATDVSSFEQYYVDNGVTNLVKVVDTLGRAGNATRFETSLPTTNAVITHVETVPGKAMPVFDFGNYRTSADAVAKDAAAWKLASVKKPAEIHEVFSDANNAVVNKTYQDTFGAQSGNAGGSAPYTRMWNGQFLRNWDDIASARDGYLAVNGETAYWNTDITGGFHVLSSAPLTPRWLDTVGNRKSEAVGGCYIGELIAYETLPSAVERRYIQDYLKWKWLDGVRPSWTNTATFIEVAAGATFAIGAGNALAVPELRGAGTVQADALSGVSALSVDTIDGEPGTLTVNGNVAFAPTATVTLGAGLRKLPTGDYEILTATGDLAGAAHWTVVSDIRSTADVSVVCDGSRLLLRVRPAGLMVIVR